MYSNGEFPLAIEWGQQNFNETMDDDSMVSAQIVDQWSTDSPDEIDIMEVDPQINLLEDDIFSDPCTSPTGPFEELVCVYIEDGDTPFLNFFEENDSPTLPLINTADVNNSSIPFEARYKATLTKLQESMNRSKKTRMSLKIKTEETQNYERQNLSGVLSSIEQSTEQLQDYLRSFRSAAA